MKVECCICLDEFSADGESKIVTPKCGHLYHENCINSWLTNNASCPQCRHAVNRNKLQIVHLTATAISSSRRSSIFNSSLCQDYRELNESLLAQQENHRKKIEHLEDRVQKLIKENDKLKTELCGEMKEQIRKLSIENEMLKKEISGSYKIGGSSSQNERRARILLHQQSVDSYNNVQSIVAKAWKRN